MSDRELLDRVLAYHQKIIEQDRRAIELMEPRKMTLSEAHGGRMVDVTDKAIAAAKERIERLTELNKRHREPDGGR